MSKQVMNLVSAARKAAQFCKYDSRFKSYLKFIDSVDDTKKGGYMFAGSFVGDGTVSVDFPHETPRVLLLMTEEGSRANRSENYELLRVYPDGRVVTAEDEEACETNRESGWALRMLPYVQAEVEACRSFVAPKEPAAFVTPSGEPDRRTQAERDYDTAKECTKKAADRRQAAYLALEAAQAEMNAAEEGREESIKALDEARFFYQKEQRELADPID